MTRAPARGDDPGRVVALVERVRRAVEERDPVAVQAGDHVDRGVPVLDEVVGVRLEDEADALALEVGRELVERAQEHRLGVLRGLGPTVELGVHRVDAEVDGDLDGPAPGTDGGLAGVLVGPRPAQHRQHRGDPDAGVGGAASQRRHGRGVDARVGEERDEVLLRGELHPLRSRRARRRRAGRSPRGCGGTSGRRGRASRPSPVAALAPERVSIPVSMRSPLTTAATPASQIAAAA